jgi:para-nitrobenzyl esterase
MNKSKLLAAAVTVALSVVLAGSAWAGVCDQQVDTAEGPVLGRAHQDLAVCEYKGIPYAADPVGDLRWKPPVPAPAHESALKAKDFWRRCVAGGSGSGVPSFMLPEAGEDCLNLNVWRPAKDGPFPVMVWIHGGSLTVGTAAEPIYIGDRLSARQDVVVVTINYRLNYFGFMAHPALAEEDPHGSAGNYGLLDQIAALQWVKDNAAAFGGDRDNVTIFGESAGGWSVCNLLASPLAAGLFDKAILESGGCDTVKAMSDGLDDGKDFAKAMGCDGADAAACMRAKTPKELGKAAKAMEKAQKKGGFDLASQFSFKWVPKVDGWALTAIPLDAIKRGEFNRVPLMVGSNRDEAKLFTLAVPGLRLAPACLVHQLYVNMYGEEAAARLEALYPYDAYRRPADAAIDSLGDMALGCRCWDAAEAVSDYADVYYYRFDYDGHTAPHMIGAAHGFEIPFVFGNLDQPPANWLITKRQEKKASPLSGLMMDYWANFARSGDPNGPGLPQWPKYDKQTRERMILDFDSQAAAADNVEKCEYWDEQEAPLAP